MGNANCRVNNDTEHIRTIHVFNYADGIRLWARDTVILKPGETRKVEAAAHGSGLILATDIYNKGNHMSVGNGELATISQLDRADCCSRGGDGGWSCSDRRSPGRCCRCSNWTGNSHNCSQAPLVSAGAGFAANAVTLGATSAGTAATISGVTGATGAAAGTAIGTAVGGAAATPLWKQL